MPRTMRERARCQKVSLKLARNVAALHTTSPTQRIHVRCHRSAIQPFIIFNACVCRAWPCMCGVRWCVCAVCG
jgi:hypothetical protein